MDLQKTKGVWSFQIWKKIIGQNILLVLKVYLMSLKLFIPLSVNAYVGNKKRKIINHYASLQLVIIIINTNGGATKGLGPKVDKTL